MAAPEYRLTSAAKVTSRPSPRLQWGRWRFNPELLVLELGHNEVDLEVCLTPARVLDAIAQIQAKQTMSRADVGDLVEALCTLLKPQATLCSWGQAKEIDARELPGMVRRNAGLGR